MRIKNFGGNIRFEPKHYYEPRSEQDVLDILEHHKGETIRVQASGHSWSELIVSKDVLVSLKHMDKVSFEEKKGGLEVRAQAGCTLQDLLSVLHKQTVYTFPTLGGIKKQTIAGAISTATHGSGHPSLSHSMKEIRIASYDTQGKPEIRTYQKGKELQAVRCALGCMGIIVSVKFDAVPKYWIRENIAAKKSLEEILLQEEKYPLQQFVLFPYSWKWFAFEWEELKEKPEGIPNLKTRLHRLVDFVGTDMAAHFLLGFLLRFTASEHGSSKTIKKFYRSLMPKFMAHNRNVVDDDEHTLTLAHYLFRHLEMEIFVPKSNIAEAVAMIELLVSWFAGDREKISRRARQQLYHMEILQVVQSFKGSYTHHYPISFRRVLPDDTLISMTAGAKENYYSISFFTYLAPTKRAHFLELCRVMAFVLVRLYDARLHWGKYFPLRYDDIRHLYPELEAFQKICKQVDPQGTFQNEYTRKVLGFH